MSDDKLEKLIAAVRYQFAPKTIMSMTDNPWLKLKDKSKDESHHIPSL